tara:strand:- start:917 stop:1444 length:528 start_codon:yes stop_codon:yes gene_type:complete
MAYFEMFPKLFYDNKGDGKETLQTNLLTRLVLRTDMRDDAFDFDYYDVKDGETPEMIAYKYYDDVELHWTIFLANNIVDYYEDWPMSVQRFEEFVKEKYANPQAIHHYEITQTSGDTTETIDVGMNTVEYPSATPISNYTYEDRLQEKKRQIRLIQPRFIPTIVEEFENKIDEIL